MRRLKGEVKIGDKYHFLTVIGEWYHKKEKVGNKAYCRCRCDCGTEREIQCARLRAGHIKACGSGCPCHFAAYLSNLTLPKEEWQCYPGERYGRLLIIGEPYYVINSKHHKVQCVKCKCDCETEIEIRCKNLHNGTCSCGCLQRDLLRAKRQGTLALDGKKKCCRCKQLKTTSEFTPCSIKEAADGFRPACICCQRDRELRKSYGINIDEYEEMAKKQDYRCAICGSDDPQSPLKSNHRRHMKFFSVDHDHTTGKIRGLLCFKCNTGIGNFGESLERLEKAVAYMKSA